jgi:hypothetical protein
LCYLTSVVEIVSLIGLVFISRRRDQLVAKQLARAASDRALFTLREWAEVAARKSFQRRQVEDFRQLIQDGFLLRLFVGWCAWAMLRSQKRSLVAWRYGDPPTDYFHLVNLGTRFLISLVIEKLRVSNY